jgi:dolichol-phosphate mannosyltransferase
VRFGIVGALGYVLAMAVYAAQIALGVSAYAAVPAAFVLNGLFNFTLNKLWTFPPSGRALGAELVRFWVVGAGSLVVNYCALYVLHDVAGIAPVPAQAAAIVAATPVGFLGNKLWSFRG